MKRTIKNIERNKRLIEFMKSNNFIKESDFAKAINMNPTQLNHLTKFRRELKESVALQIRNYFPNINIDWLLFGKGEMSIGNSDHKVNMDFVVKENDLLKQEVLILREKVKLYQEREETENNKNDFNIIVPVEKKKHK